MTTILVENGAELYTQTIEADGHQLLADEPIEQGGQNQGPTPYHYLLAALGSCTSITTQMYARRKQWPLQAIRVVLEHERIHAKDCEDCESEEGQVSEIRLRLELEGELSDEQRQRLFEIAGKCPVKKTLTGEIKIRSSLA